MAAAWWHRRPLSESRAEFGRGDLQGILSVAALVCVALIPFFMFREVARVIGRDRLWRLFFARRTEGFSLEAGDEGQSVLAADRTAVDPSLVDGPQRQSAFIR